MLVHSYSYAYYFLVCCCCLSWFYFFLDNFFFHLIFLRFISNEQFCIVLLSVVCCWAFLYSFLKFLSWNLYTFEMIAFELWYFGSNSIVLVIQMYIVVQKKAMFLSRVYLYILWFNVLFVCDLSYFYLFIYFFFTFDLVSFLFLTSLGYFFSLSRVYKSGLFFTFILV